MKFNKTMARWKWLETEMLSWRLIEKFNHQITTYIQKKNDLTKSDLTKSILIRLYTQECQIEEKQSQKKVIYLFIDLSIVAFGRIKF